jgi:NSS family neurotransmitter:Na+ symporter
VKIGKWYNFVISYLIPIQAVILLGWWLISSISWDEEWWNPFRPENFGTAIFQWSIVLLILYLLNKKIVELIKKNR